jgi:hypothetical protein
MFSLHNNALSNHGFYINLPSSIDRLSNVEKQIKQFEIQELTRLEALQDPLHQASATKSHFRAFEISDERGYESICVFEDDFQLYENVNVLFEDNAILLQEYLPVLCEDLKKMPWDVVLLGFNGRKHCIPVSPHLSKNFKSTGAWAYIIKKRAYQYILNNFNYYRDRLAIDDILPYLTYCGFNSLATNIQIFHHGVGFISTLQPSLGPVDYSQWIWGNYQRTIWGTLDTETPIGFYNSLYKIYEDSEFNRNTIVNMRGFDGDIDKIRIFMQQNPKYSSVYCELVENYDLFNIQYNLNVESPYLVHTLGTKEKIIGLGNSVVDVVL